MLYVLTLKVLSNYSVTYQTVLEIRSIKFALESAVIFGYFQTGTYISKLS